MGEIKQYQPLTLWDRITVVLYRLGIALSSAIFISGAYFLYRGQMDVIADALIIALYVASALSVFFIHLYVRRFKRNLIVLYVFAIFGLVGLFIIGSGSSMAGLRVMPYGPILLLPLAGCLGFVCAKEAFCFGLLEGYLLAIAMPVYLLLASSGVLDRRAVFLGLSAIAAVHLFFTLRKVFQPLHYDIGDKSAYQ